MKEVIIEEMGDGTFGIYEESGQCVEPDFLTHKSAEQYAKDNNMKVVENFHI